MKEFVKNISISKAIFHMIILLLLIMFIRQSMYSVQRYLDKKTNFDNTREVPNTIFDILLIIFKKKNRKKNFFYTHQFPSAKNIPLNKKTCSLQTLVAWEMKLTYLGLSDL